MQLNFPFVLHSAKQDTVREQDNGNNKVFVQEITEVNYLSDEKPTKIKSNKEQSARVGMK